MKTKMTVIVDNIAQNSLPGEWGLSILFEYGDKKILADTGASELFADNMKKLGIDINGVDFGVLSHAHYDHANGIERFLCDNKNAKFYLRESTAADCYFKKFIFRKYIGIPKNILSDYSDRIEFASGDTKICEGVYLIPHKTTGLETIGRRESMYRKVGKEYIPDDFSHEQSLVLETEKGLVIVNCCSHGGAANIINEVKQTFPEKKVYGIIGGFHLYNKSEAEVRELSQKIKDTGIEYVCTGHCTKDKAFRIMKQELGDKLEQLHVGLKMEF